jgi:hypothetical protein
LRSDGNPLQHLDDPVECKVSAPLVEKVGENFRVGIQDLFRSHLELECELDGSEEGDLHVRGESPFEHPEVVGHAHIELLDELLVLSGELLVERPLFADAVRD